MTRWRTWQRALLLATVGVIAVGLANLTGTGLTGRYRVRHGKHIVAVLADPSARPTVETAIDRWSARAREPVRVEWLPSPRIVSRVRGGEPIDLVVVVGASTVQRVRGELAEQPGQVIRPDTWLGAVTDLGQPLSRALRRGLPRVPVEPSRR